MKINLYMRCIKLLFFAFFLSLTSYAVIAQPIKLKNGMVVFKDNEMKSNSNNFNKLLAKVGAHFYQLKKDTITSLGFRDDIFAYNQRLKTNNILSVKYSGHLKSRHAFGRHHYGFIDYAIYPIAEYKLYINDSDKLKLGKDVTLRQKDSILLLLYNRMVKNALKAKFLYDKTNCFVNVNQQFSISSSKIKLLNANKATITLRVFPYPMKIPGLRAPSCLGGLHKTVYMYKKNKGIVKLDYSLVSTSLKEDVTLKKVLHVLDKSIKNTWGIIRFDK